MPFRRLSANFISQVQSSIRITSLGDVVLGLLDNSLDAGASRVHISLDAEHGSCTVEGDGLGISPNRFDELDSTAADVQPLDPDWSLEEVHKRESNFLASVAALSKITITSKHHQNYSRNALLIQYGDTTAHYRLAHSSDAILLSPGHGTTVAVRDLFGRMPVRIKQRKSFVAVGGAFAHSWLDLRRRTFARMLAKVRSVDLTVREMGVHPRLLLRVTSTKAASKKDMLTSLLSSAAQLSVDARSSFILMSASTSALTLKGLISIIPVSSKSSQFVSIGTYPCDTDSEHGALHDVVNQLFDCSDFAQDSSNAQLRSSFRVARMARKLHWTDQRRSP